MNTIKELFTDDSKWIKGQSWRKKNGEPCFVEEAECFCLSGAVVRIYTNSHRGPIDIKLDVAAKKLFPFRYYRSDGASGYIVVNDHPDTIFEDIMKIVEEANV